MTGRTAVGRWLQFVQKSAVPVRGKTRIVHVIDREGSSYELFHGIMSLGDSFVIRISLVVAWRSLLLRHESRRSPEQTTAALSHLELHVLRVTGPLKLSPHPSAREALLAVAAIGGHIKNNGDPGWLVIGRGMERLLERVFTFLTVSNMTARSLAKLKAMALAEM
jgi:hypothetical protein